MTKIDIASYYPAWVPFKIEGPEYRFTCPVCGDASYRFRSEGETWTLWNSEREEFELGEQRNKTHLALCRNGHEWSLEHGLLRLVSWE